MLKKGLFFLALCATTCLYHCKGDCFDLEIFVNDRTGRDVREGSVQLKIGNRPLLAAQTLNQNGKTVFVCVSADQLKDSVQLVYLPAAANTRFRYIDQNAYTAEENKKLRFTIDFPEENTSFEWSLRDKDSIGIVGAKITLDRKYIIESGAGGYFSTTVPKPAGDSVHFLVEKDGKILIDRPIAVFPEYRRLIID